MKELYNDYYLSVDKLSINSQHLIRIRLLEFLKEYQIKNYPINCFRLLDKILNSKKIELQIQETDKLSNNVDAVAEYFGEEYGYCIIINKNKKGNFKYSANRRCNFTIAHELAHIFLGHLLLPYKFKTKERLEYEDLEADEIKLLFNRSFSGIKSLPANSSLKHIDILL
jgi:hypothetical protein